LRARSAHRAEASHQSQDEQDEAIQEAVQAAQQAVIQRGDAEDDAYTDNGELDLAGDTVDQVSIDCVKRGAANEQNPDDDEQQRNTEEREIEITPDVDFGLHTSHHIN